MFVKSDIRKMTIALEKVFSSEVYLALGQAGIIHLSGFYEKDASADSGLRDEEELTRDIVANTDYALRALLLSPEETEAPWSIPDKRRDAEYAAGIKKKVERALRLREKTIARANIASRSLECLDVLSAMGISADVFSKVRFVQIVFGTVENSGWDVPMDRNFMLTKTGNYVLGISLPADYPAMLEYLKDYGFVDQSGACGPVSVEHQKRRVENLKRRGEMIDQYLQNLKEENGPRLRQLNSAYRAYDQILKAMRLSFFSERAVFITGWMDIKDIEKLDGIIRRICGNRFILSERRDANPPVRLLNRRLFKPFELLVTTMGMPSNSEIDPTPLAAITFVLMFGLMFGDLGQGIVLAVCGWMLKKYGQKKMRENLKQAGGILVACGLSAALCGLLYGSIFSSEHIIEPLWFHPTAHIMTLFAVTILMGAIFIVVGLLVNIINSMLNTNYTEAFLEKRGLAILVIYAAIVLGAIHYQMSGKYPSMGAIGVFVILPLIIFSLRGVLGPALFHSARPHSIAEYVIETVMDIVELALSLFSNTLSFIRVGAFALSHAGLSIVTYTLAGMADPHLRSAGALVIIIIGNIFIIGFEGLICGIQSMRLEYYEFFGKFFKGGGIVFSPFTIQEKTSEV